MSFCVKCGSVLRDGVRFCEDCGAKVSSAFAIEADEDSYDEDVDPEVEDCDEEPEKGPPSDCYATFEGRNVAVYRESGAIYRRFSLPYEVLNAQVCGENVSITCEGGWFYIYTLDGRIVRRARH